MSASTAGFAGRYDQHTGVDVDKTMRRLRRIANIFDTAVTLPGGYRVGATTLVGLAPVVGDVANAAVASYFIYEGHRLGLPKRALAAMAGNVGLDLLLGVTPLLGDLADTWFKANVRNLAIVEKHMARRGV